MTKPVLSRKFGTRRGLAVTRVGVYLYRVRRMNTVKWMILAVLISLLTSICLAAEKSYVPKPAQSIDELGQQLEKILKDTHTNGVSVAIVHKNEPQRVPALGIADVPSERAASADT